MKKIITDLSSRLSLADHLTLISVDNANKYDEAVFILYNDVMRSLTRRAETGSTNAIIKPDFETLGPDHLLFNQAEIIEILVHLLNAEGIQASVVKDSPRFIKARWPRKFVHFYERDN